MPVRLAANFCHFVGPGGITIESRTWFGQWRPRRIIDDDTDIASQVTPGRDRTKHCAVCIREVDHELAFQITALAASAIRRYVAQACSIESLPAGA